MNIKKYTLSSRVMGHSRKEIVNNLILLAKAIDSSEDNNERWGNIWDYNIFEGGIDDINEED